MKVNGLGVSKLDILIVVVLYNKQIDELSYLKELKNVSILVYDNSPTSQIVTDPFLYVHNPDNVGVSAAYNFGIDIAKKEDFQFIILLDQDTNFNNDTLSKYNYYKVKYGKNTIYAPQIIGNNKLYSPFVESKYRNIPFKLDEFNYKECFSLENKSLINSGLMIPLDVINKVGKFNEQIKLDFSDTYFIEKYKEKYNSVILMDLQLKHSLSGDEGFNKVKELKRFQYFCEGALEFKKSTNFKKRTNKLILYRTLRLLVKYKTLEPIIIMRKNYLKVSKKI